MARGRNTRIKLIGGEMSFAMRDPQFEEMRKPLDHYRTAARDFSPVFEDFSRYHARSILRNFTAQGRPSKWAPLAAATIEDRIRKGYGPGPILVRTGGLRKGWRYKWGAQSYRVDNRKHYWIYHQLGAPANRLPARPMLVLLPQDLAQFTRIARHHLGATE